MADAPGLLPLDIDVGRVLAVVAHPDDREPWAPGRLNSADHRALGQAALDAVGDAGNRWLFTDLRLDEHSVRHALVAASPVATHALDVTATVDRAVASLAEHRAYLEGLGDHPMSDPEFLRMFLDMPGERFGGVPAVPFEVFSF